MDKYRPNTALAGVGWPAAVSIGLIVLGIAVLGTIAFKISRRSPDSRVIKQLKKGIEELKKEIEDLKEEGQSK